MAPPSDRIESCRDYLLCHFSRNRIVNRTSFQSVARLDVEQVDRFLNEFAVPTEKRAEWEWKVPTDTQAITQFHSVVQSHTKQLQDWEATLHRQLNALPPGHPSFTLASCPIPAIPSAIPSVPALPSTSPAQRAQRAHDQLVQFLMMKFEVHGVCGKEYLWNELQKRKTQKGNRISLHSL